MEDYEKFTPEAIFRKKTLQLKLKSKDELIEKTKKEITEIKKEIEKIDTFLT
jgi:hypothetical protein